MGADKVVARLRYLLDEFKGEKNIPYYRIEDIIKHFDREDERQSNLSTKQQEDLEANIKGLKEIMGADYE